MREHPLEDGEGTPSRDPLPEDPPESNFLLVFQQNPWGYDLNRIFDAVDDLQFERFNDFNGDFDLDDFDVIWAGNYQPDGWTNIYNDHLEEIEDFVDGGGAYYMSSGTNNWGVAPVHPGGLIRQPQVYNNTGVTVVPPEECYMFELMEWDEGQQMQGNSFHHSVYADDALEEIENSDELQLLIDNPNGQHAVLRYTYGGGHVIASGSTDGFLHNNPGAYIWGAAGGALLYYLDALANDGISWLEVEPSDGIVPPGETAEIGLIYDATDLEAGDYFGIMIIESNDPENPEVVLDIWLKVGVELEHYVDVVETEESHTLHVVGAAFDGEAIGIGWEIGVFDPDGNLGGAAVWTGEADIEAYASAEGVDQFDADEGFTFMLFDPNGGDDGEGMEWNATPNWMDGPEVWNAGGESTLGLIGASARELTVGLSDGWNLMSINVVLNPADWLYEDGEAGPDVTDMFRAFAPDDDEDHNVILLKNGVGQFWVPAFGFNSIPYWDYAQGYQVKINEASDISWSGAAIPADADVPMSVGWNMIGYFPTYGLDASAGEFYVLSPIIDRVIIAKEGGGRFMIPGFDFSNMAPWSEGFGYQVKLNEEGEDDITFNYPEEQEEGAFVGEVVVNGSHWTAPTATEFNMSLLITDINGIEIGEGDQIAAFSSSGIHIGLGSIAENRSGLAVWSDKEETVQIEDALEEKAFTLKLWDADKSVERDLEVSAVYAGKGLEFDANAFVALEVTVQTLVPDEYSLSQNFPNPFNSITRLSFGLPEDTEVSISVFDVSGRLVTTLVNGDLKAGTHIVSWNAQSNAAGLYLVRMETMNGFNAVKKVALLK
jgi:hypothetical protein